MKRRNFLQASAALTLPALAPITGIRASTSPFTSLIAPDSDRVLVIVHLFGGNDGLNTLIPLDQLKGLNEARSSFHVKEKDTLKISDTLGFHPQMDKMRDMFKDDRLRIVQSAGYPNHNRSHFRSTDIWTSASKSDELLTTGWMGRYLDTVNPGYPNGYPSKSQPDPPAISIGNIAHPTCEGMNINFSQTVDDPGNAAKLESSISGQVPNDEYGQELSFVRTTIRQTNDYNAVIQKAYDKGANKVTYFDKGKGTNNLAVQLAKVARLISGGLQTKVYTVYMTGFDTHAEQVGSRFSNGYHASLLSELSEAVASFQKDLVALKIDDRVLGMTFSEFGRRIRDNDSRGTDHGTAAPMFLFGSCVNAGVEGDNPDLSGKIQQSDGVPVQFDFRDVYGSILVDWFDVPTHGVRNLLHSGFKYMPVASNCNEDKEPEDDDAPTGWDIGQPFLDSSGSKVLIPIGSPANSRLRYTLFDGRGRMVLANEITVGGQNDYTLFKRPVRLPSGTYSLRMATDSGTTLTRKVTFK